MKSYQDYGRLDMAVDRLAGGQYTIPASSDRTRYDHRSLSEYAKQNGKCTSDLTDKELAQFVVRKPIAAG